MISKELPDNPGVIAPPPLMYAGSLGIGLLLHVFFPVAFFPDSVGLGLGILTIVIAGVIVISAFRVMSNAQTNVNPYRPTTSIVNEGVFRYSRNPIYLSLTLLYLGITMLVNNLWTLLLLIPLMVVMQYGVVHREERYLEHKFGEEYLGYKASVRRWF